MSSMLKRPALVAGLVLAAALGGCAGTTDHLTPTVAETPVCGPRAAPEEAWPTPISGYGCATAANLAAMVADPRDLIQGQDATPPAGDAALAAAQRHRLGQVKPLPTGGEAAAPTLVLQQSGSQ